MVLRRRALATVLGVAATFLAVVQVVTLDQAGGGAPEVLTAIAVGSIGFVPVALLIVLGRRLEAERRSDWLVCFIAVAAMLGHFLTASTPPRAETCKSPRPVRVAC
jgi:hypothetical protein